MSIIYFTLNLLLLCIVCYSYSLSSYSKKRLNLNHNAINNKKNKAAESIDSVPSNNETKRQFKFSDLLTLIQMGAGAPSLGEYERTDENGKMFFKLEANNAYDKDGNSVQTKAKYFLDGYVEEETDKPPGFFENLLSGGKKQGEWESRLKNKK